MPVESQYKIFFPACLEINDVNVKFMSNFLDVTDSKGCCDLLGNDLQILIAKWERMHKS